MGGGQILNKQKRNAVADHLIKIDFGQLGGILQGAYPVHLECLHAVSLSSILILIEQEIKLITNKYFNQP